MEKRLNQELRKVLTEHQNTLHPSPETTRPRSRSASTHPSTSSPCIRPQPAPMPLALSPRAASNSEVTTTTQQTSPVTAGGRSRSTSIDSGPAEPAKPIVLRTSLGSNQALPTYLQTGPARPVPPPRTLSPAQSPVPSPIPSPHPSPRASPALQTAAAAAAAATAASNVGRPRSATPPGMGATRKNGTVLRQIEDTLNELSQNLGKVSLSQSKELTAAKANVEALKVLFSQFIAGAPSQSNSSLADAYWIGKIPQIIKAQSYWRRILIQRKFIAMVNQDPLLSKRIYRRKVVKEILTTEKSYLDGLRVLVNDFQLPLIKDAQAGKYGFVTEVDLATVFSNVSAILQCNEVLYKDLQEATSKSNFSIGAVFKRMGPYFRLYSQYVSSRDAARNTLLKCKQDEAFNQFLEQKENQLSSLLITPVQRVPRYVLLLTELVKRTDEDDTEKERLQEAVALIREVAEKINETKRVSDSLQKLVDIQQAVQSPYNFVEAHRTVVREGPLSYQMEEEQPTEIYGYLMSDVLMLTSTGLAKSVLTSVTKKCILLPLVDAKAIKGAPNNLTLIWEKANNLTIKLIAADICSIWLPDIIKIIAANNASSNPTTIDFLKPIVHYGSLYRKSNMRWKKSMAVVRGGGLFIFKSAEKKFEVQKQYKLSKIKVKELENCKFEMLDVENNGSTLLQTENTEDLKVWISKLGGLTSPSSMALSPTSSSPSSGMNHILFY